MDRTELCQLALKYKTDKVKEFRHNYTPFYYDLLKHKQPSAKTVLEIGIGHRGENVKNKAISHMMHMPEDYLIGASLYMWRDFFIKADVYGVDINPVCLFEADRIHTFLADQSNQEDLERLVNQRIGKPLDVVIDDGSHIPVDQVATLITLVPQLSAGGIYIIEDVSPNLYGRLESYFTEEVMAHLRKHKCVLSTHDLRYGNPGVDDEYLIVVKKAGEKSAML
jgi:cephalosporin hydroxylase